MMQRLCRLNRLPRSTAALTRATRVLVAGRALNGNGRAITTVKRKLFPLTQPSSAAPQFVMQLTNSSARALSTSSTNSGSSGSNKPPVSSGNGSGKAEHDADEEDNSGSTLEGASITLQDLEVEANPPKNSREAQFLLGLLYMKGQGSIPRDTQKCLKWLSLAAANGCVPAQTKLASLYLAGYGVKQNPEEAARLYEQAAEAGDPEAQGVLGYLHQRGTGVKQDLAKAAHWFLKAADGGNVRSQTSIGFLMLHGVGGVTKDVPRAVHYLEAAADGGQPEAACIIGVLFASGAPGVASDPSKAHKYLRIAADAGDKDAQANLGDLYLFGKVVDGEVSSMADVERMMGEAAKWYTAASDQGVARAQCSLGLLHYHGLGVPHNLETATKWLGNAANAGLVDAVFMMGVLCATTVPGAAAPLNLPKAKQFFEQLAEQLTTQKPFQQTRTPGGAASAANASSAASGSELPSSHSSEAEARARGFYEPFVIAGVKRLAADPTSSTTIIKDWQKRNKLYWYGGLEKLFRAS